MTGAENAPGVPATWNCTSTACVPSEAGAALATATSARPSPFRSPTATFTGSAPVWLWTGSPNVPGTVGTWMRALRMLWLEGDAAMAESTSSLPSPFRSVTATDCAK